MQSDKSPQKQAVFVIYKHTSPSGKAYIGQTKNYQRRTAAHKNNSLCRAFYNAIQKYGWDNFNHEILESGLTIDQANERESFYIETHNTLAPNGYNLRGGGGNAFVTDESIEKMSARIKAIVSNPITRAEHSAKIKAALSNPEVKAKHSACMKEIGSRLDVKAKRRDSLAKAKNTPEVKAKRSESAKAAHAKPEVKAKHSAAIKAALNTTKTKEKIAANWNNPEIRAKRLAAIKAAHARPEVKVKRAAASANLEVQAKRSAPEVKAKISASLKAYHAKKQAEKMEVNHG